MPKKLPEGWEELLDTDVKDFETLLGCLGRINNAAALYPNDCDSTADFAPVFDVTN